ncbi:energy-coupling factor ABC transporter ATP-binding protein [Leucobacter sp. wl10]|uniref:energy-coupling factor ABC transporter ATP-binding protein n=1 Tax=Leucobacter sp. wl10 TaxID=2304677 RepID=UPI000E5A317B|nr:ABC transporter ATP-binding protein [Leucobacter sp. wl10]RGE21978.1 ABC transporter ATP-binding protein [Leucobacter sp. wl10]
MIALRSAGVVAPTPEGETTILQPTSLELSEHRISIIGGNGSGKSTLARLLNGLLEPTTGEVLVLRPEAGSDALDTRRDGPAVRRAVGFVFTDPAAQLIMPTVLEDVALSLRRSHRDRRERNAAALAALERFGLDHLADRSVHTLSGGQKQLLAIATVLATGPSILVADEPTTLLDLRNSRLVGDLLMSLPQQVVVVTHDLELAERADRTIVIASGRVAFDGDSREAVAHYRASVA